jgi:hypothetical protein
LSMHGIGMYRMTWANLCVIIEAKSLVEAKYV